MYFQAIKKYAYEIFQEEMHTKDFTKWNLKNDKSLRLENVDHTL